MELNVSAVSLITWNILQWLSLTYGRSRTLLSLTFQTGAQHFVYMHTSFPPTKCSSYGKNNRAQLGADSFLWTRTFNMFQLSAWIMLEDRTRTEPCSFKTVQYVHFLNQRIPFIMHTKCTFLVSTNIKWASPKCFGIRVPNSGRIQWKSEPVRQCLTGSNTRHITNTGTQSTSDCYIYRRKERMLYGHTKRSVYGQTQY